MAVMVYLIPTHSSQTLVLEGQSWMELVVCDLPSIAPLTLWGPWRKAAWLAVVVFSMPLILPYRLRLIINTKPGWQLVLHTTIHTLIHDKGSDTVTKAKSSMSSHILLLPFHLFQSSLHYHSVHF